MPEPRMAVRRPQDAGRWLPRVVTGLGSGLVQLVLVTIALVWMVPVIGLLVVSLRRKSDGLASGWWVALTRPAELTLTNYSALIHNREVLASFGNTALIAVPATALIVMIAAPAAYTLAWMDFPGRHWLTLVVVALLIMPFHVALIPVAKLYGWLGLFGTIPGVVLYHVAFGLPLAIYLLRNFFATIPRDLLEAARMDGAHEWRVFWRVVLPIGLPAIASLAIFMFLWVWNDFLVSLVFSDPDSAPITVALRQETNQFGINFDVLSTGSFLSMLVPLLVFFAFQGYFRQGVLAGSTK